MARRKGEREGSGEGGLIEECADLFAAIGRFGAEGEECVDWVRVGSVKSVCAVNGCGSGGRC